MTGWPESLNHGLFPFRRRFPWNIILLTVFVSPEGWRGCADGLRESQSPGRAGDATVGDVSGSLCHRILTPAWVSRSHLPTALTLHPGHAFPLLCFTLVSFPPSDSRHGLHDRHHCQVQSGTAQHAPGKGVFWGSEAPWAGRLLHGGPGKGPPGSGGFEVSHMCLWPLSPPSLQHVSDQGRHHLDDHHCRGVHFGHHLLLPDQGEGTKGPLLATAPPFLYRAGP